MPFYSDGDEAVIEQEKEFKNRGRTRVVCYSRIVGYLSPINQWNKGKQAEWKDRKTYDVKGE